MKQAPTTRRRTLRHLTLSTLNVLLVATLATLPTMGVRAATVNQLKQQKAALEQQARQAQQQAQQQKSVAERASDKLQELNGQIGQLENSISDTQNQIADTKSKIDQQNQEVARLESELGKLRDQQDALIREMYVARLSQPDNLILFSDDSIGKREQQQAHFDSLKKAVASITARTEEAKAAVQKTRDDLVKKQGELESMKAQQDEQQRGLADMQADQAALKDNAEQAVVALESRAKNAQMQEGRVEQQINAALAAAIAAAAKTRAAAKTSNKPAGNGASAVSASSGHRVAKGTIVGHLGNTGFSTGPHVHFEIRANGSPVNPQPYVNNGTVSWPVSNFVISQGFGYTDYAASGAYGGSIHTGIDLAGPYGQPVYAPASGTIILKQYYGGYGNAVAIQLDNGLVVLMGHMTGS